MAKKTMTMGFVTAGKKSNSTSASRSSSSNMVESNSEVTSAKAASAASKVLRNPKSSPAAKTAAASALTQRPNKSSKTGTFVLEKPGKGINMKESRQRMLKQLDGSFKRLA